MSGPAAKRPTVGVIGLGRMGAPIAARLREAELEVIATDRRPEAGASAAALGLRWAASVGELAAGADVVLSVLPGPGELRSVIQPILGELRPGAAWIDMTSGVPDLAHEIREQARGRVRVLECPVGGGPREAADGQLLGYLGGDPVDRVAHSWLLGLLCGAFAHTGPAGTGYAAKLLVNLLWFGQALAVSEVLAIAARLGLDPAAMRATLSQGAAASRFIDQDLPRLLSGDDMTSFALSRCVEELEGVLGLARARGLELPVAGHVTDLYRQALDHFGEADGELLAARLVAERLGVDFARVELGGR